MTTRSLLDAFRKLDPRTLWRAPVMFVVEVGAAWTTVLAVLDPTVFGWLIVGWLWLTVLFANLAEAVAEGRGRARADSLRKAKTDVVARRLTGRADAPRSGSRRLACAAATAWSSRLARSSRATATWWTASRAWTSRPSPANRPRSSANRVVTGPR